jgi:hypothetical protein
MLKKYTKSRLYCFSPPVMVLTAIIEIISFLYVVFRYKLRAESCIVALLLLTLAVFQICEYNVCEGYGFSATVWSRIGYVAITLLPPLGLHLLTMLAHKHRPRLVFFSYITAALCIAYFLFYSGAFSGYECTGNYVIFQIGSVQARLYSVFYYSWLVTALMLAARWHSALSPKAKKAKIVRSNIRWLSIGYLVFLLPTAFVNTIQPETTAGIPSIMCGFAVLLALILVFGIKLKDK